MGKIVYVRLQMKSVSMLKVFFVFFGSITSVTCLALDFKMVPIQDGVAGSGGLACTISLDGESINGYLDSGAVFTSLVYDSFSAPYIEQSATQYETLSGEVRDASFIQIGEIVLDGRDLDDRRVMRFASGDKEINLFGIDLFANSRIFYNFDKSKLDFVSSPPSNMRLMNLKHLQFGEFSPDASIQGTSVETLWDTGASLTTVSSSLVSEIPDAFEFIQDAGVADDGSAAGLPIKLYKMKGLKIGDESVLSDVLVYTMQTVSGRPPLILGYNVITQFNWYFDLIDNRWGLLQR